MNPLGGQAAPESPGPRGIFQGSGMDVAREPPRRRRLRLAWLLVALAVLASGYWLARLKVAVPSVARDTVLFGRVERGTMVRAVGGPGTLVPERVRYVSAITGGRVEQVLAEPGTTVRPETELVVLSNPDVELEALEAEQELEAAELRLVELRQSLGAARLEQEASLAEARAEHQDARRVAAADETLGRRELIPRNDAERSSERLEALEVRVRTEEEHLSLLERSAEEQLAAQAAQVERLRSIHRFQRRRVASMRVRAGGAGVLQDLSLEPGQWVQPGTTLARVAEPGRLKAVLRIPQLQARDIQAGQEVSIDARSDLVAGRVRRIDPNVQDGAVRVEVSLEGELPPGARSDVSVDGTIVIERLTDVLYVDRPVFSRSDATMGLFKVVDGGDAAIRVQVELGRSSVRQIEVIAGAESGDELILSDMTRWDGVDRIRLH